MLLRLTIVRFWWKYYLNHLWWLTDILLPQSCQSEMEKFSLEFLNNWKILWRNLQKIADSNLPKMTTFLPEMSGHLTKKISQNSCKRLQIHDCLWFQGHFFTPKESVLGIMFTVSHMRHPRWRWWVKCEKTTWPLRS